LGWNSIYLNGLGIKLQTLLLVGEELLNVFALITLKLNHLSHFTIDHNGAIASYGESAPDSESRSELCHLPNFFLMTLRIFFWSNFFGRP
jgi:hypothetical protein